MPQLYKRPFSSILDTVSDTPTPSSRKGKVRWSETNSVASYSPAPSSTARRRKGGWSGAGYIDDEAEEDEDEDDESEEEEEEGGMGRRGTTARGQEGDEGDQGGDTPINEEKKILCIYAPSGNRLAAAYYDPTSRKVLVMEDTKDTWCWDLAVLVMEQVQPDLILRSTKTPDKLNDVIEDFCKRNPSTEHDLLIQRNFAIGSAIHSLDRANFTSSSSKSVVKRDRGSEDYEGGESVRYGDGEERAAGMGSLRLLIIKLGCWVNVDAPLAVSAAGALVDHIMKQHAESGTHVQLASIESMDLERHMVINQDALTSLAIFDVEGHAFIHSNATRQTLSLHSILNTAVSSLGKKLLHTWMLRPLLEIDAINARLDAVQLFATKEHSDLRRKLKVSLKKISNVSANCGKIARGRETHKEWSHLLEAMNAMFDVKDSVSSIIVGNRHIEVVDKLCTFLSPSLHEFGDEVTRVIDFDSSADENRVCVRPGVDEDLDRLKRDHAKLESMLSAVARIIVAQAGVSTFCKTVQVYYIPQFGYVLAAFEPSADVPLPANWVQEFTAGNCTYYKTPETNNLNEHYGDLFNVIAEHEWGLVQNLTSMLSEITGELSAAVDVMAELDCLVALAEAVDRHDLRRPVMKEEPVLKIRKGRHLIQELCVPANGYIDNDTFLHGGQGYANSMMVVTGANGSGKSAYGKQVALITFMAQIGSFVPAESAEIGICDKIYTRLQTRESASKAASAFMIDLSQVSLALRGATERSLIILDEFGKGTTPADGAGLLAGVITHLLTTSCPRTVVLTHFHEMFTQHFIDESLAIVFCHMRTVFVEDKEQLTYLFKLAPSLSTTSNAADCALQHGIPQAVVDRAREVSKCVSTYQISALLDQELDPSDIAEMAEAEQLAKRFLRWEIEHEMSDVMEELKKVMDPKYGEDEEGEGEGEGAVMGVVDVVREEEGRGEKR